MAGDLPFEEILVIHEEPTATVTAARGAAAPVLAAPAAGEPGGRVLQRYGDRVEIRMGAAGADPGAVQAPRVSARLLATLSETERLGVQALQLRASKAYVKAKTNRPRQGEVWDMPGCAGAPAPPHAALELHDSLGASAEVSAAGAEAGAPGTSDYLMGSVAVGLVIVNGPTTATKFTAAEQTKVVAEVQAGLGWLAGFNPWAGVSFVYDIRPVSITTKPTASAPDNESRFRNPAVGKLGFQQNWNGVWDYVNWLRTNRKTNWAYSIFFVKGYPARSLRVREHRRPADHHGLRQRRLGPGQHRSRGRARVGPHLRLSRRVRLQRLQLRRRVGPVRRGELELRELRRGRRRRLPDAGERVEDVLPNEASSGLGTHVAAHDAALVVQRRQPQRRQTRRLRD